MSTVIKELAKKNYGSEATEQEINFGMSIIRECINVAKRQRNPQNLNYKPSEQFADDLKRHFEVYDD